MAKKFVRGITEIKDINKQDFDTNNVNDILSDGEHNYIHRKKGKSEEYHNLTDNIKTISSDNTDLLTVTNNNKTNNTATLSPKHDAQKEQVLESERATITIKHGTNATPEKTKVDTNPKKVLEHEKLKTGDGLTTSFNTDETTIMIKATKKPPETDLNSLGEGIIWGNEFPEDQAPSQDPTNSGVYITLQYAENEKVQFFVRESFITPTKIIQSYRFIKDGVPTPWKEMAVDRGELLQNLALKQNKLTAMGGISITGDSISLATIERYSGDLNNLTYTCQAKPAPEALNLPTGAAPHGILKVVRISDVVSQQYHTYNNNSLYIRSCRNAGITPEWTQWIKVTTTPLT